MATTSPASQELSSAQNSLDDLIQPPLHPPAGGHQYHGLINEVQHIKNTQQDLITQLNIKIAVLENELEHAREERENGLNSLRIVVESLARTAFSSTLSTAPVAPRLGMGTQDSVVRHDKRQEIQTQLLEAEIERLRKENRFLRGAVRDIGRGESFRARFRERDEDVQENRLLCESGLERELVRDLATASCDDNGHDKGKEKAVDTKSTNTVEYRGLQNVSTGLILRTGKPAAEDPSPSMLIGSWGQEQSFKQVLPTIQKSWGQEHSFEQNLSTIPNTPNASFDVGLNSLEESLEDGFPEARIAEVSPPQDSHPTSASEKNVYPELEKGIDEQLADAHLAMLKFRGPSPSIVKTGFQLEGNKRGDDYDPSKFQLVARTYIHSKPVWRDSNNSTESHSSIGPGTAFEIPKDRSFDSSLWSSVEEREDVIRANMYFARESLGRKSEERVFPDFFRYGIQYRPDAEDSNYARAVHVSNLPADTELREVLARVRGGQILGATLLDTMKLTCGMTARVVFKSESAAEEYVLWVKEHPIVFGEEKQVAVVDLIDTPTYPFHPSKKRDQTRCIAIPEFPENPSLRELQYILACRNGYRAESLVEFWIDEARTLHLEFSSMDIAGSAYGILTSRRLYGTCFPRFDPDPCAGPLEGLEQDIPPRPPVHLRGALRESTDESFESSEADERGEVVARQVECMQRKRLAALSNQKVEIPSFSGAGIISSSWADEVIDEADDEGKNVRPSNEDPTTVSASLPNIDEVETTDNEISIDEQVNILYISNVNKVMAEARTKSWEAQKQPIGLAGSKYATFLPAFVDRSERPQFGRSGTCGTLRDSKGREPIGKFSHQELSEEKHRENSFTSNMVGSSNASSEDLAVQAPGAHRVFGTADYLDPNTNKYSRSPPRFNLQDLIESSEPSKSRSPSPVLGKTAHIASSVSVQDTDMTHVDGNRLKPQNSVRHEVLVPEVSIAEVSNMEKKYLVSPERRKSMSLKLNTNVRGRKQRSGQKRAENTDKKSLIVTFSNNGASLDSEAAGRLMYPESGKDGDGDVDAKTLGVMAVENLKGNEGATVSSPDEISLDDEDDDE